VTRLRLAEAYLEAHSIRAELLGRNVTPEAEWPALATPLDSTPFALEWEEVDGRHDPEQRFALYRLCECEECSGTGKVLGGSERCSECRGEGRVLELLCTAGSAEAVGTALVTLSREGEWAECPLGLLDRQGEKGKRWLILPWLPSPRNASDAGRLLQSRRSH